MATVTEILAANPKFAQADAVVVVPINGVERVPPAEQAKLLITQPLWRRRQPGGAARTSR